MGMAKNTIEAGPQRSGTGPCGARLTSNREKMERIDVPQTIIRIGDDAFRGGEDSVVIDRRVQLDVWWGTACETGLTDIECIT